MAQARLPRPKDPAAAGRAEVIELLFTYVDKLRVHFEAVAKAHDLTPVQAKVVLFLGELGEPGPMRCVSDTMGCDPSNITGVVDRLEERGFLSRHEGTPDRRMKILKPTPAGRKLRESIESMLFKDVPGMDNLSKPELNDLRAALAKLCE
jgi:DNA-binding MarR family transcriptional regulator